jgi:NADH dehydrogenase FAD-containing subunit
MPQSIMDLDYFNDHATFDLKRCIEEDRVFGDHVQFVQGMLIDIPNEKSIKIKRTDSVEETKSLNDIPEEIINFDFLVICTGSHYIANEMTVNNVARLYSKQQRFSFLKRYQTEIENANSILIVGGGATGTECLGEIQSKYGDSKKYGLITNQKELLVGFPDSARTKAMNHFTNSGVKIYTNERFYHDSDLELEYDFVLMCMGQSFHTPFMDNGVFKD